jgi:hypothetical protein
MLLTSQSTIFTFNVRVTLDPVREFASKKPFARYDSTRHYVPRSPIMVAATTFCRCVAARASDTILRSTLRVSSRARDRLLVSAQIKADPMVYLIQFLVVRIVVGARRSEQVRVALAVIMVRSRRCATSISIFLAGYST